MPIPRPDPRFIFIFYFSLGCGPHFPKNLTDENSGGKKKKKRLRSLQGHTEDVCKFDGLTQKNGEDIRRGINLGFFNVNQPVE